FLDFILTGNNSTGNVAQVWHNLGNGTFSPTGVELPGVDNSAVAWGDLDNDGKLDFVLTGDAPTTSALRITQLWRNLGGGIFTNISNPLTGVGLSAVAIADFDGDGRSDILISGG